MPILLSTEIDSCAHRLAAIPGEGTFVLAAQGDSTLEARLRETLPGLVVAQIGTPRFARLNFDFVRALVLDLNDEVLLSSPGRRLAETLGRLARESLFLSLVGPAAGVAGGLLADGLRAGLSLVPHTAVLPDLRTIADLRTLLATLSASSTRLLALDAPVTVCYDGATDRVSVVGTGSALLASFAGTAGSDLPTARLHVLSDGMSAAWPDEIARA